MVGRSIIRARIGLHASLHATTAYAFAMFSWSRGLNVHTRSGYTPAAHAHTRTSTCAPAALPPRAARIVHFCGICAVLIARKLSYLCAAVACLHDIAFALRRTRLRWVWLRALRLPRAIGYQHVVRLVWVLRAPHAHRSRLFFCTHWMFAVLPLPHTRVCLDIFCASPHPRTRTH